METLSRWVEKIYPSKEAFVKILHSKKGLVFYHGIDPTAPHLHLGHSTNLFLLKKLQQLGHKVILLIGDFTAQIGDPTGKDAARKPLTKEQIKNNCKTYQQQVSKFLDFKTKNNPAELKFNSQWLDKLTSREIIKLAANVTHGQMIKRSMFQKRLKENKEIYLHEFLYPLFQGYDSVAMDVDGEVGGDDQTFNMLVGRDLMKIYKNKEKLVVTTPLLVNPKTGRKLMSKTESFIALDLLPNEMYGQVMALPDEVVTDCFKLCTEVEMEKIKNLNPRQAKAILASEIVKIYHGEQAALSAEKEFNRIFRDREMPSTLPVVLIKENELGVLDLLIKVKMALSKAEARRLIVQGGVKIDNEVQKEWQKVVEIKKGQVIQVGKRKFVKIA
ncbi:MAG: tyrosine--tRNA ligase [Patescibacteria group bacterium]